MLVAVTHAFIDADVAFAADHLHGLGWGIHRPQPARIGYVMTAQLQNAARINLTFFVGVKRPINNGQQLRPYMLHPFRHTGVNQLLCRLNALVKSYPL